MERGVTTASDEAVKPQDRSAVYVLPTYPCQFAYFSKQKVRYLVFLLDNLAPKRTSITAVSCPNQFPRRGVDRESAL